MGTLRRSASRAARTPLFATLRRAFDLAAIADRPGAPPLDELVEMRHDRRAWSRREFLGATGAALLLPTLARAATATHAATPAHPTAPPKTSKRSGPRVVIVGAGLAGLDAAFRLHEAGIVAAVYDAAPRAGGRVFTGRDLVGPGLTTELGGEFIDTDHAEMLDLARVLGLRTLDRKTQEEARYSDAFWFDGTDHSEAEAVLAVRPLRDRIVRDAASLGDGVDTPAARELDRLSLAEYLDRSGTYGWVRRLIEVAYITEFGLEPDEQTCLNLVTLFATGADPKHLEPYGKSDERFKIAGGNQQITDALARKFDTQLHLEHRLDAVRERGTGFTLSFTPRGGGSLDVDADIAILTLPFTLLRQVDLQVTMQEMKRRAIDTLGYGTGSKLLLGFETRPWREMKRSGGAWSDEPYQSCWDHTRLQPGPRGGLTVFCGGRAGEGLGTGGPQSEARRLLPGLDHTFPGLAARGADRYEMYRWPTAPFALGSYACYQPGQWTEFAAVEGKPEGNLLFAGEHCSVEFQGYMNGAAETGRRAAERVIAQVHGKH